MTAVLSGSLSERREIVYNQPILLTDRYVPCTLNELRKSVLDADLQRYRRMIKDPCLQHVIFSGQSCLNTLKECFLRERIAYWTTPSAKRDTIDYASAEWKTQCQEALKTMRIQSLRVVKKKTGSSTSTSSDREGTTNNDNDTDDDDNDCDDNEFKVSRQKKRGTTTNTTKTTTTATTSRKETTLLVKQSDHHVECYPKQSCEENDEIMQMEMIRTIVENILKVQTLHTVSSTSGPRKTATSNTPTYRLLIIIGLDEMTRRAQQLLNFEIERYHHLFRLVLLVRQPSRLTPELHSRYIFVRIPAPTLEHKCNVLQYLLQRHLEHIVPTEFGTLAKSIEWKSEEKKEADATASSAMEMTRHDTCIVWLRDYICRDYNLSLRQAIFKMQILIESTLQKLTEPPPSSSSSSTSSSTSSLLVTLPKSIDALCRQLFKVTKQGLPLLQWESDCKKLVDCIVQLKLTALNLKQMEDDITAKITHLITKNHHSPRVCLGWVANRLLNIHIDNPSIARHIVREWCTYDYQLMTSQEPSFCLLAFVTSLVTRLTEQISSKT